MTAAFSRRQDTRQAVVDGVVESSTGEQWWDRTRSRRGKAINAERPPRTGLPRPRSIAVARCGDSIDQKETPGAVDCDQLKAGTG